MSNKGRVLTLVITIKDPEAAKAIWDIHQDGVNLLSGFAVDKIAEGDVINQRDEVIKEREYLKRNQSDSDDAYEPWFRPGRKDDW